MLWRKVIIIRDRPQLGYDEVVRCLSAEVDKLPILEAVRTVIAEHKEEWQEAAPSVVSDHGRAAGHIYAVHALDELDRKLVELREKGRADAE